MIIVKQLRKLVYYKMVEITINALSLAKIILDMVICIMVFQT